MYDRIFKQTSAPTGEILVQELFASAREANNGFCGDICRTSVGRPICSIGTSHCIDHL